MPGRTRSEDRQAEARELLAALGDARPQHELLVIQCARSHHVAEVISTPGGAVYLTRTGPPSYGRMDRPNLGAHGAPSGIDFTDLLVDPMAGDELPAWCDCGPRTLSREWVLEQLDGGSRTVRV